MESRKSTLWVRVPRYLALFVLLLQTVPGWVYAETRLRVMTANTTSGNGQSYDPGHGIRFFQGLKPDIALIQEFNYGDNSPRAIRQFVDIAFGKSFSVFREDEPSDQIPNGIVSRYPILESGEIRDRLVGNRDFVWAKINVPGEKKLWVFSVHLLHNGGSRREAEAELIVDFIKRKVPPTDYLIIGGDFNTKTRTENALKVLGRVVTDRHVPVGPEGLDGTNQGRKYPYDWVLPNPELDKHHACVEVLVNNNEARREGVNLFSNGLVFDSRTFRALNAVPPVQPKDSGTGGMQHMPVIKDFVIP